MRTMPQIFNWRAAVAISVAAVAFQPGAPAVAQAAAPHHRTINQHHQRTRHHRSRAHASRVIALKAPQKLASVPGNARVALSWSYASPAASARAYVIFRDGGRIAATSLTRYTDLGAKNGVTYTYYVKASQPGFGMSSRSNVISATPSAPRPVVTPPMISTPPAITGTVEEGHSLVASTGTWHNSPSAYAYQWSRCDSGGANCRALAGMTSGAYVLGSPDVGSTIKVTVTAVNLGGTGSASSNATSVVVPLPVVTPPVVTPPVVTPPVVTPPVVTPPVVTPPVVTPPVVTPPVVTPPVPPAADALYVATTGSDANPCTQAQPCLSFDRAYHAAAPGQTVLVASGAYNSPWTDAGSQRLNGEEITWDATKANAADNVIFRPDTGATVYVNGNLRVMSSHVEFWDMTLADPNNPTSKGTIEAYNYDPVGNNAGNDVSHITFGNLVARDFSIFSVNDLVMTGTSIGPSSLCGSAQPGLPQYGGGENKVFQEAGAPDPDNITFSNDVIHNVMSYDLVTCHVAGIVLFAGTNVTITGTKFYGDDVEDLEIQNSIGAVNHVTLTNNWFANATNSAGTGTGVATFSFENANASPATFADSLIEGNSATGAMMFDSSGTGISPTNFRVIGNLGQMAYSGYCPPGFAGDFQYNVWQNSACGPTDQNLNGAAMPFVNATSDSAMNYALTAGSIAQGFVPANVNTLTATIDGSPRPGASVDAGAS